MWRTRFTIALALIDMTLVMLAWATAFWLRFNLDVPQEFGALALSASPWCFAAYAVSLAASRVYRQVWSYIGLAELRQLTGGILLGAVLTAVAVLMLRL